MWTYGLPAFFAVVAWWLSTGLALRAVATAERAPRATAVGSVLVFGAALAGLAATAADPGIGAAYVAFTAALAVWGVQEVAFLAGWVTGPWRKPCPPGAESWLRAGYAVSVILHHELALAASGIAVVAATWNGPNQVGSWTFAVLFAMRISAKLNVFLGVPNLTESFLPEHLGHLKSFFGRKSMNLLFPVSVTASTVALVLLAARAAEVEGAEAVALTLVATLVGLALLEHWFLVLPLPIEALWAWGHPAPAEAAAPAVESGRGAEIVHLASYPGSRAVAGRLPLPAAGDARAASHLRHVTGSD